jgi:glucose-6-phosphate 1-dehydrogenase
LFKDDLLDEKTVILGITRRDVSVEDELLGMSNCASMRSTKSVTRKRSEKYTPLRMHQMSQTDPAEYKQTPPATQWHRRRKGCLHEQPLLPEQYRPRCSSPIVRNLGEQGLNQSCQHDNADTRLLVEKPFGYDLAVSARAHRRNSHAWFREEQLFRIDHYLAKDTVQNIIAFRAENSPS